MKKVLTLAVLALAVTGCGSNSTTNQGAVATPVPAPTPTSGLNVTITPSSANLNTGQAQPFVATVTGLSNTKVNWSLLEGAIGGVITKGGAYTAPMVPGLFHVFATSMADASVFASAAVTVSGVDSGPFTPTGSMHNGRGFHTATLLADGNVLVAGGDGGDNPDAVSGVALAELYDPSAGRFASTSDMTTARYAHTATRLRSGKVLVTGGLGDGGFSGGAGNPPPVIGSAELYDPANGSFAATGSMATARVGHTATLLPGGRVLIVGGLPTIPGSDGTFPYGGDGLGTAEIYDPATGAFTPTGSMATLRYAHTATLLATGKVLIAGGISHGAANSPYVVHSTAELYDPATGAFTPTGSMEKLRYAHTATLLATGNVLIVGGADSQGLHSTAELYDPATSMFAAVGSMGTARSEHTATLLHNGKVLVAGGWGEGPAHTIATAELFDPASGTFKTTGGYMQTGRAAHAATQLQNGKTVLTGGDEDEFGDRAASADLYE